MIIRGPDGRELGRGLVAYDAEDAERIIGSKTSEMRWPSSASRAAPT